MVLYGENTLCCGEGGAVPLIDSDLAHQWTEKRAAEAARLDTITYCGGCVSMLDKHMSITYLVDMLMYPERGFKHVRVNDSFTAYRNRLNIKK